LPLHIGVAPGSNATARSDGTLETVLQMVVPDTLVLCWSDHIALGILAAAQRKGVAVPGHFALAGFDGLEIGELVHPTLTTAMQPWREMARHAAERLAAEDSPSDDLILPISVRWGGTFA
jgi:LacI family transcriptional regulator